MNIAAAKQQIENAIRIYLQKDELGNYMVPLVNQRPIFIQGAPGLGKTAIMAQISKKMGIGLVAYSMTHHTRQSAIGLPMIVEKEFDGKKYSVSEYTMSEIIASVYECMQETGCKEGILFLDEINCISETLSPAMLLFLQYKIFGGHSLPKGWVVVTAGNQARYNKSVRDFDAATMDRLKYIKVEPDYESFKEYALSKGVNQAVIRFLDVRQDSFYVVENKVERLSVVTPRSWEDLSLSIRMHEMLGLEVTEELIGQYIQNATVARDFSVFYQLYHKYREIYDIENILNHNYDQALINRAREAGMDERITLEGLLRDAVVESMNECVIKHDGLKMVKEQISKYKDILVNRETDHLEARQIHCLEDIYNHLQEKLKTADESNQSAALSKALKIVDDMQKLIKQSEQFSCVEYYKQLVQALKGDIEKTQFMIGNFLAFMKDAYGEGNELGITIHDLTVDPKATAFIGQFLSIEYFRESNKLQLHKREEDLLKQIELKGIV